jgi:hypothetical protein
MTFRRKHDDVGIGPTLGRLGIPAHWSVLHSTVKSIEHRNVSQRGIYLLKQVAFGLRRSTRADD